ncbi:MAG: DNA polymerase IV [Campylobacterales bacterium]|nr:DNA polymerase IV [Campylobacterales bacterium]
MILHIDLDCYYCSAERIRNPSVRGIPLAVGGSSNLTLFGTTPSRSKTLRGVVVTSSYEARARGVKTGMNIAEALRFCPALTILPPDHGYYRALSAQLFALLQTLMPTVEQCSIDEFFCDISGMDEAKNPEAFALHVKLRIAQTLGLPVSIGVSPAKWIAKLATNAAKPDGIRYVPREAIVAFIAPQPIEHFPGIGKSTQEKLHKHGIQTLGQAHEAKHLFWQWGEGAKQLWRKIAGEDKEVVEVFKQRKSIGLSRTFDPIASREELHRRVAVLVRHIAFLVMSSNAHPATFSLTLRYEHGGKITQRCTQHRSFSEAFFCQRALELFHQADTCSQYKVNFLGVNVSHFLEQNGQSVSLLDFCEDQKYRSVEASMHQIRVRYGLDAIMCARELKPNPQKKRG